MWRNALKYLFLAALSLEVLMAWTAPIGIPTPSWGANIGNPIDAVCPARPSPWNSEIPGYYYVDGTSGSDSGRTYGYPGWARKTIPSTVPAGSYVECTGTFTGTQLILTCNGTSEAWVANTSGPVWIRGNGSGNEPTIQMETIIKGGYVFLEWLKWDTDLKGIGFRVHSGSNCHYACLRNSEISGSGVDTEANAAGVGIYGAEGNEFHDIVIYNCTLHDLGTHDPLVGENDYHGVSVGEYCNNLWMVDCTAYHCGGDGIQTGSASITLDTCPHHVYVGRNSFYDNHENAIDIKITKDIICSTNTCYDYQLTADPSSSGVAVVIHGGSGVYPDYVWIINNTIYNCEYRGIITTGSTNTYILGNLIYDVHGSVHEDCAAIYEAATSAFTIVGNTIYDCDTGIAVATSGGAAVDGANNIVMNIHATEGYHVIIYVSGIAAVSDFINSDFYQAAGSARISWGDSTTRSVSGWKTAFPTKGTSAVESDPVFVSAGTNFRLQTSSPCKDAGAVHSSYAAFLSRYGESAAKDLDTATRPIGAGWDMGAYEFGGEIGLKKCLFRNA